MGKKKRQKANPGRVILPVNHPNPPEQHEVDSDFSGLKRGRRPNEEQVDEQGDGAGGRFIRLTLGRINDTLGAASNSQ